MTTPRADDEQSPYTSTKKSKSSSMTPLFLIGGALIIGGLGFVGGMQYQKTQTPANTSTASTNLGQRNGAGFRRLGGIGTVTAISATSITTSNARTGASKTYAITSATKILDNSGAAIAASSIQVGDRVIVTPSTTDATTAAQISVNLSFGGMTPGGTSTQTQ